MRTRITFRRSPRPIPSKFFEYTKIGGPKSNVRYIYVGKWIVRIRRFEK
jgi:hypothetical protein